MLEEWELCEELQLEEQHEVKLSDGLLQEELDDLDSLDELLLKELKDGGEVHDNELLLVLLDNELSHEESEDEKLDRLCLLKDWLELLDDLDGGDEDCDDMLDDCELHWLFSLLELQLTLHAHWLCDLEEELSLRTEEDKELEDELVEKMDGEDFDMLELLIDSALENVLLEEYDE